jgi:cytosine/adenosine deaminase-related metal-dependent hydrolase
MGMTKNSSVQKRTILSHGRIINPGMEPAYIDDGHIVITGDRIDSVSSQLPSEDHADQVIDLKGKTVLPGMINSHTHLYSALALGMPPPTPRPQNFVEHLRAVWWKLDRALDEASTVASFEAGLAAALRGGVTTVIDHHSSQNYISGSLHKLVDTAQRFGVTISPSFEITDRNGRKGFDAALRENLNNHVSYHDVPCVHPMIGLHASFTLSEDSLVAIRKALEGLDDWGIHIHVAEDQADEVDANEKGYPSVVQRLRAHDLVHDHCLFIHGLHSDPEDLGILKEAGVALVHNPTSNANNRVGLLKEAAFETLDIGLGTDGMQANMLSEAKEGALIRSSHLLATAPSVDYIKLLFTNNPAIASRLFGYPLGHILPGYQADLAIYDYHPRTDMNETNWPGHVLYGLALPCDVITRGEFRIREGKFQQIDEDEILTRAQMESARLWAAMGTLSS